MSTPPDAAEGLAATLGAAAFPEVVRLLHGPAAGAVGRVGTVAEEAVLFRSAPSLGFPAGDMARLYAGPEGGWPYCLEVNFLGLYGPSSPLPTHWTEEVVIEGPSTAAVRDVLDLFGHPLVALSYRAWRHYRLELDATAAATDRMSRATLAVAGVSQAATEMPEPLEPARLLPLCGLLAQHARSAAVLCQVLEGYFGLPADVEEFRPRRAAIAEPERFRLGRATALLGEGTVLGESVMDVGGGIGLTLGPLDRIGFAAFLPNGSRRPALRALVQLVLREPLECLVTLRLAATAEDGFVLGQTSLGWFSWLAGPGGHRLCPAGLL